MKKGIKIAIAAGAILIAGFCFSPVYVRQALIHLYPEISDTYLFPARVVHKPDTSWEWLLAREYNRYTLSGEEEAALEEYGTVAFLVIRNDSVVYEEYRDGWTPETLSNIFSATKSIVGLLIGIAYDEGYITSLDDKVSEYLPEFKEGGKDKITIRHLLTMSSGLNWDEAYSSLFSTTTRAYYGDRIRDLVMGLGVAEEPGKRYAYKSGDTQLLSFVLEAALNRGRPAGTDASPVTISEYAEKKLWQPLQASHDALWNLDREGGDEKTYCCFNTTARDLARLARLILRHGDWNGKRIISEDYIREAVTPARYLENEFGDGPLDYYGFQIWTMHYKDMAFPAFRGLGGQYVFAIPGKNAIVVRLGHKRSDIYHRENTVDMDRYLDIAFRMLE